MKEGIRILALDDSRIRKGEGTVLVVGMVGRSGIVEGVLSFRVEVNGCDSTDKIMRAVRASRFSDQIRLVAINGTTVAGMNVIDISMVGSALGMPVLGITRKRPHPEHLKRSMAAAGIGGVKEKIRILDRTARLAKTDRVHGFYVQRVGRL